MTPERLDIALLELRVEQLERRDGLRQRGTAIALVFGFAVSWLAERSPWLSHWLSRSTGVESFVGRWLIVILAYVLAYGLIQHVYKIRERRAYAARREALMLSLRP